MSSEHLMKSNKNRLKVYEIMPCH